MKTGFERRWAGPYGSWPRQPGRWFLTVLATTLLFALTSHAQLAITEMMSKSAGTLEGQNVNIRADFWELTNFGSSAVDLTNYKFADNKDSKKLLVPLGEPALIVPPGQSVIFVRYYDEAFFRAWWGSCLDPTVQVRTYPNPGFSSNGDRLSLYDPVKNLVDQVDFAQAEDGVSFVYDPVTGEFTSRSLLGENGACRAALSDDIASPGVTTGPIPLKIVQDPTNVVVYPELDATFTVSAIGLPRPRDYKWYFNGNSLPGNNQATLTVTNVTSTNQGYYSVRVRNGFSQVFSAAAQLIVNTTPSPPVILAPPVDATVVTNRTARFSVSVAALPLPSYQWLSNGIPLEGATNRTLFVPDCSLDMSGDEFCVRVQNSLGTQNACARLYVTERPDLRITEIQAFPVPATGTNCVGHNDWFEVTNFGSNTVNLLGYRFSDGFTLLGSVPVTQPILINPRESVVFVKNPSTGPFIDWWGASQLPRGLKIFPYGGFSLSSQGDTLYLWPPFAEDPDEFIDGLSFASNQQGISQRFDYDLAPFGADSVEGQFGAFRTEPCGDVGSPGYTVNPPPRFVSIVRDTQGAHLTWRGITGKSYRLQASLKASQTGWFDLVTITATNPLPTWMDPGTQNANQRFYRVIEVTK